MKENYLLKIGMAQISPVWLNRKDTEEKVISYIKKAGSKGCDLVVFGEGILPGYPFWLSMTNGSKFNSKEQKEIHAHYLKNSVKIGEGGLGPVCLAAAENRISVYLGVIERAVDRGGHSLYCSLVYINKSGEIGSVHRKLQPTYEERLTWSPGDGHGLQVHKLNEFTVGGLNCWENWMPLARTSLYALGEDLHIAVWPGSVRNTEDITRMIAKESRSYVVSVSGLMKRSDIPDNTPNFELILDNCPEILADGGSCISSPDGKWVVEPVHGEEQLITAELDISRVFEERQNFDPSGHYSRPDVTQLIVDRSRQSVVDFIDSDQIDEN